MPIKSINGEPIVLGSDGIEDGSIMPGDLSGQVTSVIGSGREYDGRLRLTWTPGNISSSTGEVIPSSSNFVTGLFAVSGSFRYSKTDKERLSLAQYDANGEFLSYRQSVPYSGIDNPYTLNADTRYVRFATQNLSHATYTYDDIQQSIMVWVQDYAMKDEISEEIESEVSTEIASELFTGIIKSRADRVIKLESGKYGTSYWNKIADAARVRSTTCYFVDDYYYIEAPDGYLIYTNFYDVDLNFLYALSYSNAVRIHYKKEIGGDVSGGIGEEAVFFNFTIKKEDESDISDAVDDIQGSLNVLMYQDYIKGYCDNKALNESTFIGLLPIEWSRGRLSATGEYGTVATANEYATINPIKVAPSSTVRYVKNPEWILRVYEFDAEQTFIKYTYMRAVTTFVTLTDETEYVRFRLEGASTSFRDLYEQVCIYSYDSAVYKPSTLTHSDCIPYGTPIYTGGSEDIYPSDRSVQTSYIYGYLNELLDDDFTRTTLGQDDFDNDIYCYTYSRKYPDVKYAGGASGDGKLGYSRPKIIIVSGTHGDEKGSVFGLARFLHNLCTGDESAVQFLRETCDIITIPIVNPSGFNSGSTGTRLNGNGVNINRDYRDKSQPETRIVCQLMDDNDDALIFYDFHNNVTRMSWWGYAPDPKAEKMFLYLSGVIDQLAFAEDPALKADSGGSIMNYYEVGPTYDGMSSEYAISKGMFSTIVESSRSRSGMTGVSSQVFDELTTGIGEKLLANSIIMTLTQLYDAPGAIVRGDESLNPTRGGGKLYAFGDSTTYGQVGGASGVQSINAWPNQVGRVLNMAVSNQAVGGQGLIKDWDTINDTIDNLDMSDATLIIVAWAYNDSSQWTSIPFGAYNVRDDSTYLGHYWKIMQTLQEKCPTAQVMLVTGYGSPSASGGHATLQSQWTTSYAFTDGNRTTKEMYDGLEAMCHFNGWCCVNQAKGTVLNRYNASTLIGDQIHPNEAGYKVYGRFLAAKVAACHSNCYQR